MRRLLVIGYFHRQLVPERVRILLVIGIFRARLTAYTHRKRVIFAKLHLSVDITLEHNYIVALVIK